MYLHKKGYLAKTNSNKNSNKLYYLDNVCSSIDIAALAVALGNLYHDDIEVETSDVVGVLAAAHILKFKHLQEG